jgi:NTP pyrophosphatase (non-canonical NTP hydrolase)
MSRRRRRRVMDLNEYQKFCEKVAKKDFKTKHEELVCWGLGVAGEAGDLAGCIKKLVYHYNDQMQGIRENCGDVLWYLAMICNVMNWNLEDIIKENVEKLSKRYPHGFTYKGAQRDNTRKDWMEEK